MRPWQAIILIILLAFFAISSGWHVLYILTYVLLSLLVLSWLWARYSLRKMIFRRTASSGRVQVGETFDERVLPISNFVLFSGGLPGRGRTSRRALQATTNATTIREYMSGDALNRIHWRSSAHYNKLMVKEFDLDPALDVWIFLDLHDEVQAGEGEHSTDEYGVTIAATLANYLLRQDLSLGMIVNADNREFLSLDRGDRQIERVLELLAVVEAGPGPDLKEALATDAFHFGRNTVAIVITPSASRDWHDGVRHLQRRGVQVAVVGLDAASFENAPPGEDKLALLEGAGIPVLRITNGESLTE